MSYQSEVLARSPLAYWKFDEELDAGAVGWTYGSGVTSGLPALINDGGAAMRGDGANPIARYATIPPALAGSNVSFEAWIRMPSGNVSGGIVTIGTNTTNGWGFGIGGTAWDNAGTQLIILQEGIAWQQTGFTLAPGIHHIVVTRSSANLFTAYVDGVSRWSSTFTPNAPTGPMSVGGTSSTARALSSTVHVDNVAMFPAALSAARVSAHYNTGNGDQAAIAADGPTVLLKLDTTGLTAADSSGNGRALTHFNSPSLGMPSLLADGTGKSIGYNGSTQFSSIASAAWMDVANASMTVVIDVDTAALSGTQWLASRWQNGGAQSWIAAIASGKFDAYVYAGGVQYHAAGTNTLTVGKHSLGWSYDGSTLKTYIDGALETSVSAPGGLATGVGSAIDIARTSAAAYGAVKVDEFAHFGTALSDADHLALHNAALASSSPITTVGLPVSVGLSFEALKQQPTTVGFPVGAGLSFATSSVTTTVEFPVSAGLSFAAHGGDLVIPNMPDDNAGSTYFDVITEDDDLDLLPPLDNSVPLVFIQRPIMRRSVIVPDLRTIPGVTIDPVTGQPRIPDDVYDALPVIEEEVGIPHLIFPDSDATNDATFYRGGRTQIIRDRREEPFGDALCEVEIPVITTMDLEPSNPASPHPWTTTRANMEIITRKTTGEKVRRWAGNVHTHNEGNSGKDRFHRITALGSLRIAAFDVHKPVNSTEPFDYGYLIPRDLNGVGSHRYKSLDVVTTGILSRERGSWSDNPLGFVQSCLAKMYTAGANQWTVAKVPGSRREYELRLKKTGIQWTVTNGARGVSLDLTRDISSVRNVIYGYGTTADGGQWFNTHYGNQGLSSANPWPFSPSATFGVGATGDAVLQWQQRANDLGYDVPLDGVYNTSDAEVAKIIQRRRGLDATGVVDANTWTSMFGVNATTGDLGKVVRVPLAFDKRTQRWLLSADGSEFILNPDFDENYPVFAANVDFEQNSRIVAAYSAQQIVDRESEPSLTGKITLRTDPREGSRIDIEPGDNIQIIGYKGTNPVLHIAAVDRSWQVPYEVTLEVDEHGRDAMTLAEIRTRNREARRDPARRPGNPNRRSGLEQDQIVPFDSESPAGRIPRHPVQGRRWSVNPYPFATTGRIAKVHFECDSPFFVGFTALPISEAQLDRLIGDPSGKDDPLGTNLKVLEEQFGLVAFWGQKGQRMGYSPGREDAGNPFTGMFDESSGFDYVSGRPPWLWGFVYPMSDGYFSGRCFPSVVI